MLSRLLFNFLAYFAVLFFLRLNPCHSQEAVSNLDIFDATADWGAPRYPPLQGEFKRNLRNYSIE